jgi:hypothetical protein
MFKHSLGHVSRPKCSQIITTFTPGQNWSGFRRTTNRQPTNRYPQERGQKIVAHTFWTPSAIIKTHALQSICSSTLNWTLRVRSKPLQTDRRTQNSALNCIHKPNSDKHRNKVVEPNQTGSRKVKLRGTNSNSQAATPSTILTSFSRHFISHSLCVTKTFIHCQTGCVERWSLRLWHGQGSTTSGD